jgi:flagellar motor switch/type III secretory pathway protein FliN
VEERTVLADFFAKVAVHIQKTIHVLCDDSADVSLADLEEHFTSEIFPVLNQERKNYFYLPIDQPEKGRIGFLEFPFETCTKLLGWILKNPEAEIGSNGELSPLEESILMDVTGPVLDALIEGFSQHGQIQLKPAQTLLKGDEMDRFDKIDDMCQLSFSVGSDSDPQRFSLYILDELLDPLVGIRSIDRSLETLRKMPDLVINRIQDVPIDVSARLSDGMINLQDILMLQPDDVVLLNRKVSMTADVLVNGKHCFDAWPARHAGRSAIVIAGQNTDETIN